MQPYLLLLFLSSSSSSFGDRLPCIKMRLRKKVKKPRDFRFLFLARSAMQHKNKAKQNATSWYRQLAMWTRNSSDFPSSSSLWTLETFGSFHLCSSGSQIQSIGRGETLKLIMNRLSQYLIHLHNLLISMGLLRFSSYPPQELLFLQIHSLSFHLPIIRGL